MFGSRDFILLEVFWAEESLFPDVRLSSTVQISRAIWSVLQSSLVATVSRFMGDFILCILNFENVNLKLLQYFN